jgi:hypothetical protein
MGSMETMRIVLQRSRHSRRPKLSWSLVLLGLVAGSEPVRAEETLRYRWRLDGFVGSLATIFVPGGGDGVLTVAPLAGGVVRSELLVTSTESRSGEYFLYGAEWEPSSGKTLRAWSDQVWRGEKKSKRAEVSEPRVIDVVSGIELLRRDPPGMPRPLEIWSDGRLYPVIVLPRGTERRKLEGKEVATRHFHIRGVKVGDRKYWKGELDLWIADDARATPVEIQLEKKGVRLRLTFVGRGAGDSPSPAKPAPGGP